MCVHLAKADALPLEALGYTLEGFTQCLVVEFRDIHKLQDSITTLAAAHILCSKANEVFHSLILKNKWNIPHSHWTDAFVIV